jgi:hypothetical protein
MKTIPISIIDKSDEKSIDQIKTIPFSKKTEGYCRWYADSD